MKTVLYFVIAFAVCALHMFGYKNKLSPFLIPLVLMIFFVIIYLVFFYFSTATKKITNIVYSWLVKKDVFAEKHIELFGWISLFLFATPIGTNVAKIIIKNIADMSMFFLR